LTLKISLLTFIQTGRLDEIGLGSTRTEVELAFGPPDAWDARFHFAFSPYWRYRDFELRFDYERLCSIICETFDVPEMGMPLDVWKIKRGASREQMADWLREANVPFMQGWEDITRGRWDIMCFQSRVTLRFDSFANGGLSSIWCR